MWARAAATAASASGVNATRAPVRATATTSHRLTAPMPTMICSMDELKCSGVAGAEGLGTDCVSDARLDG